MSAVIVGCAKSKRGGGGSDHGDRKVAPASCDAGSVGVTPLRLGVGGSKMERTLILLGQGGILAYTALLVVQGTVLQTGQ